MSDLIPNEVPVAFGGERRVILLSLASMDAIQSTFAEDTVFSALKKMYMSERPQWYTAEILRILLEDARKRHKLQGENVDFETEYSTDEIMTLISVDELDAVRASILSACRVAIPETGDDEDDDPNRKRAVDN